VNGITLQGTNLTDLAHAAADALGLDRDKVLVVDVRERHITFDILQKDIPQENLVGREGAVLGALRAVPGVTLSDGCFLHSNGILGLISAGEVDAQALSETVGAMTAEIREKVRLRAILFPTGFELRGGLIEDTNTPYLREVLEGKGYRVSVGDVMDDDIDDIRDKLEDALSRGFGLIVTTGGVGAEDKDKTVEAIERVDTDAATPYIVRFEKGTGRHVKDGVRIGVGQAGLSLIISLPGPHDEVEAAAPVLLRGLQEGWDKARLAESLAAVIAEKWRYREHRGHAEHSRHHH